LGKTQEENMKRKQINPLKAFDTEFEDVEVTKVGKDYFTTSEGWSFGTAKKWHIKIKVGDTARFYGKGFGMPVRGLDINGVQCFYRTERQEEEKHQRWVKNYEAKKRAEFEKNKAALDESYNNLPEIFQKRIDKFRTNNPEFRWEFESYEMFCCEQAVLIATTIGKNLVDKAVTEGLSLQEAKKVIAGRVPKALKEFSDMPWEKEKEMVPGLSDGHSGNTFDCAVALAGLYMSESPENVEKLPGALAPLVGSEKYRCVSVTK
jgi:hypothetical protein